MQKHRHRASDYCTDAAQEDHDPHAGMSRIMERVFIHSGIIIIKRRVSIHWWLLQARKEYFNTLVIAFASLFNLGRRSVMPDDQKLRRLKTAAMEGEKLSLRAEKAAVEVRLIPPITLRAIR